MPARTYYTYIMSSRTKVLYIGITSNLELRVQQHKQGQHDGFTKEYRCHHLVWFERYATAVSAITREKQIKGLEAREKTGTHRTGKPGMARPEQRLGQNLPSHRCHPERSVAKSKDPHEQDSCESLQSNDRN
jgi:putative endonuclease